MAMFVGGKFCIHPPFPTTHTHKHTQRNSLEVFTRTGRKLNGWEIGVGVRFIFHHILMRVF